MYSEPDELPSARLAAPAAQRNSGPILQVLERVLPKTGFVLEIASGTGQHVVHFAAALQRLTWQPSDIDADARLSIAAWLTTSKRHNVRPPIDLDVRALPWPVAALDAIVCINLIHIAPWPVTTTLFAGAALALRESGLVYLYGPYAVEGRHTAPSNAAFDRALRAQNSEWGVRDLREVEKLAKDQGFDLLETVAMPANNLSVLFRKRASRSRSRVENHAVPCA